MPTVDKKVPYMKTGNGIFVSFADRTTFNITSDHDDRIMLLSCDDEYTY
jgi:hypothetical protein